MDLRVVIVDDEEPARERLRMLLSELGEVAVVAEAADGEEALEAVTREKPDAIFLDIQMPGITGLEVAASLPSPGPRVVFCTAYDKYAVDAFELHAADYLLKPINRARLAAAVERLRSPERHDLPASATAAPTRFLARRGNRWFVVPAADVVVFSSETSATKLQAAAEYFWVEPSLNDLERRLDGSRFFRVSRAAIVNLDAVREVVPLGSGLAEVVLTTGERVEVSRRRFRELMERLG